MGEVGEHEVAVAIWTTTGGKPQAIVTTERAAEKMAGLIEDALDAKRMGGDLPDAVNEVNGWWLVAVDNQLSAVEVAKAEDVAEKLREQVE